MMPTLDAIKAALAGLNYPTHLLANEGVTDAAVPNVPYLVLAPATGTGLLPDELPVCGADGRIQFDLRVTAVSYPADAVPKIQGRVRAILAPGLGISQIVTDDRHITVAYLRTEVASQFDRDMSIAASNRHPSWGADSYTVHVQPI